MGSAGADTAWHYNASAALAEGVKIGFYHLLRPESSGAAQAKHIIETVGHDERNYAAAIDVERVVGARYPQDYPSKQAYTGVLAELIIVLYERYHEYPVIYTSAGEWNALISGTEAQNELFAKCPLWVANYTTADKPLLPPVWSNYWLWQWTSQGMIDGFHLQDFDLNRLNTAPEPEDSFWLYTPFQNNLVTSSFNAPRSYPYAPTRKQLHEGEDSVDGSDINGDPLIYCGRAGTVVHVGFDARGYGNFLIVDFGGGWSCWYCHFSHIYVSAGQQVAAKQALGEIGATGSATGEHCHITLTNPVIGLDNYVVANVVNPRSYLRTW